LATPPATFTVAKAAATIGRGQENTIRLDDLSVSRRHARIAYKQGGYWLSDTGSMGGTWVDGTRLNAPYRIGPGQIIDIGLCRLTVSFAAGAERADKKETTRKPRSEIAGQARRPFRARHNGQDVLWAAGMALRSGLSRSGPFL